MNIEGLILKECREGWVVEIPYVGKVRKTGESKTKYKQHFYPRLDQCLRKMRDALAKDCQSVEELISLLKAAESIDLEVLAASGLTHSQKSIPA